MSIEEVEFADVIEAGMFGRLQNQMKIPATSN